MASFPLTGAPNLPTEVIEGGIVRGSFEFMGPYPWVSAAAIGADPTGTNDCTSVLNTAIADLHALPNGGTLLLSGGTFKYDLASLTTYSNVQILDLTGGALAVHNQRTRKILSPRNWLYLPDGWDDAWRAAKAGSGATPAWVTVYGDSITQGVHSSDPMSKSWFPLLRTSLLSKYQLHGDYYPACYSAAWATSRGWTLLNPPWTIPGTISQWASIGSLTIPEFSTTGEVASFTTPYNATQVDIVYFDYGTGTWSYTVDGGAAVNVTCTGSNKHKRAIISGLASGSHTVAISQAAATVALIEGACVYSNPNSGIGFGWIAQDGYAISEQTFSPFTGADFPAYWRGETSGASTGFGFPWQPHLFIGALGVNDCQGLSGYGGLTRFRRAYERTLNSVRRGVENASILLMAFNMPNESADTTTTFQNAQEWGKYKSVLKELAHNYGAALFDVDAKWGEVGGALGFEDNTNPHPTDSGYADIAAILEGII